ncbi:MAG: dihydroorotate dehydrogenase electron transfer subunit [Planctomycetes bacterium]|nr:dihydroorotate dehydrogenase electron transfer subunit [Planctomycetota bacterium]
MTIKSTIDARVISNKPLQKGRACKYFRMALALNKPVKKVIPGQFVHIRLESKEHVLPRPFTIFDVKDKGRVIEVVYQVVGKGTELMSYLRPGHKVWVLCPLGNGFKIDKKIGMHVLVGGGIGAAGLYLLLKEMTVQRIKNIYVFIGARSKDDLCLLPDFKKLSKDIVVATEDGSLGTKGLITSSLENFLNKFVIRPSSLGISLYACGPRGMSEAVRKLAIARNIPAQLSLEARMACGVGLCRVCVCRTTKGYATVCEDGPVFDAQDLA